MSDAVDADILRRHFVAVATSGYDDPGFPPLDVDQEVKTLRDWLCAPTAGARRFIESHPHLADDPSEDDIRFALRNPPPADRWRVGDAAVVFVTGHGLTADGAHWTVLRSTESGRLRSTALRTADLIAWLSETDIQHLFLVLDLCYAGQTATETVTFDRQFPQTWLVLPSATKDQEAVAGALTTAIADFLRELGSPIGAKYGLQPLLDVTTFLDAVQAKLGPGQRLVPLQGSQRSGPHPCLPNPHYRESSAALVTPQRSDLALPEQDLLTHWEPRSRGVAKAGEPGWLFTGREELMRELIGATSAGEAGAVLVTGCAGSGKSAVLGRLVTLSDPTFRERYAAEISRIPAELVPPAGSVDAAVLATGKTSHEVMDQLCRALGVPEPEGSSTGLMPLDAWITSWQSWLVARDRPVTLVVDALDEAANPPDLLTGVLARLDPDPARRLVRLLVGVRSPGGPHDSRTFRGLLPLADRAERLLGAGRRIRVDESPWWQQADVAAYVEELLGAPGSPYTDSPLTAAEVARVLAAEAGPSFLVARISAMSLAKRDAITAADDPRWLRAVRGGVIGVFRDDLHSTLPDSPEDRLRAVHLLRATAFAYGRGLPWLGIWPAVADAVADDMTRTYGDADIAWLLGSRLGGYLVTDQEDGTTVYRLFHDALRTALRKQWRNLLAAP
ncbi:ATP-binding protein [Streptomyces sp. RPA4-5]|uniref:ATP-binding protein n=1 Tax=Streptomyces sp. RPA4-5 TaxID=2721245 RepID=UPI00143E90A2|nr:ATP-binding protein [Streptomyces sp. RPA4-5]QIY54457.1 ATP-binding protein [Streptomyces sp. RPA4-5]